MTLVYYDDALGRFADVLRSEGDEFVTAGVFLRDASGRLSFFAAEELGGDRQASLSERARQALGPYAQLDRLVVGAQEPGARRIMEERTRRLDVGGLQVGCVDRRIVGADWLREPAAEHMRPPRIVFSSLKGGVGRTTATSVVAAAQAAVGRNVLVVDLDLEAPGIGSMLLSPDRVPVHGSLDFLVESNLRAIEPHEANDFVGTSSLTDGKGLVEVVPVWGLSSEQSPEHFLEKLSRAMVEEITPAGDVVSLAEKIVALVDFLEARRSYDIVLIDARAGMSELTAGPILALGATVLLFGTAQKQTIDGYRFLFAHLSSLVPAGHPSPWRGLKMVHAKAQEIAQREAFKNEMWDLFSEYLYEEQDGADLEAFNFAPDNPDAPHDPIVIPLDTRFADWDPTVSPERLLASYYRPTYDQLLALIDRIVEEAS